MKVNFNNLRRQAMNQYNILVMRLNEGKIKEDQQTWVDGYGWLGKGDIVIDGGSDIEDVINNLRMMIGSIAGVYEEGNEDFQDVLGEETLLEFNLYEE